MIPAGYVSAAPLVRVLNYAGQNGVPTEALRRRMQLELDMPVLLDSTVPLITAMNALQELEALGKWSNFSILLGRIVASELSPLHTQLAKSVKTVADWLGVLPPTESLIGDIGNLHMRTRDDRCELIWELSLPQHPAAESVTDGMLIATGRNLDQITVEPSAPSLAFLTRQPKPGDDALKKELGCNIVYDSQAAALVYPMDFFSRSQGCCLPSAPFSPRHPPPQKFASARLSLGSATPYSAIYITTVHLLKRLPQRCLCQCVPCSDGSKNRGSAINRFAPSCAKADRKSFYSTASCRWSRLPKSWGMSTPMPLAQPFDPGGACHPRAIANSIGFTWACRLTPRYTTPGVPVQAAQLSKRRNSPNGYRVDDHLNSPLQTGLTEHKHEFAYRLSRKATCIHGFQNVDPIFFQQNDVIVK